MDNSQHTPAERAELALTNARAFCDLLAEARHRKAPGWWDGSSYRSHPCGLVADTIKFTNFWHVDNMCSIEITDGLGWGVANVSQDSFGHRSPHPAPIEGAALRVWWCGQWADAAYKEALRPRVLEILTAAAAHIAAASEAEEAERLVRLAEKEAARRDAVRVALAKATGSTHE